MRKGLIYFSALLLIFLAVSCIPDDNDDPFDDPNANKFKAPTNFNVFADSKNMGLITITFQNPTSSDPEPKKFELYRKVYEEEKYKLINTFDYVQSTKEVYKYIDTKCSGEIFYTYYAISVDSENKKSSKTSFKICKVGLNSNDVNQPLPPLNSSDSAYQVVNKVSNAMNTNNVNEFLSYCNKDKNEEFKSFFESSNTILPFISKDLKNIKKVETIDNLEIYEIRKKIGNKYFSFNIKFINTIEGLKLHSL